MAASVESNEPILGEPRIVHPRKDGSRDTGAVDEQHRLILTAHLVFDPPSRDRSRHELGSTGLLP
jgi:hypothetical protein